MGVALRLEQILLNLLSNAVKFTEKGGIRLHAQSIDNKVQIQVIDTGIGIGMSDAQLAQLFKPFEQADTSTTRRFGGTGLGLSISKNLARMMQGDIQVKTCFNIGSKFVLMLPLIQTEPKPQVPMAFNKSKRLEGINVLVAEDVELNRMVLNDMLTLEGAHITFGNDGLQALNLLKEADKNTFDIVLMDIQMPVMDGYKATQEMLKLYPNLLIIGLTAHALSEVKSRCLALGMVDHITKPVDIDNLVAAIKRHNPTIATLPESSKNPQTTEVNDTINTTETPPESETIVDWPALHKRYNGRDSIIKTLATTFVSSYKETPADIRRAIQAKDSAALSSIAHGMKGSAGYLEAHQLHQLATLTEAQVKQNNTSTYITSEKLAIAIEQLTETLREITD